MCLLLRCKYNYDLTPKKIKALEDMGIKVNQRVPIFSDTNKYNEKYISTKKSKLGHLI